MLAFHSKEPFLSLQVAVLSLQVAVLGLQVAVLSLQVAVLKHKLPCARQNNDHHVRDGL